MEMQQMLLLLLLLNLFRALSKKIKCRASVRKFSWVGMAGNFSFSDFKSFFFVLIILNL